MKFKAVGNKVVVEILQEKVEETSSAGGIILYEKKQGTEVNTVTGKVISVGNGAINPKTGENVPIPLKEGDVIMFNGAVGAKLDEKHRTLNVDDIFAIVQ